MNKDKLIKILKTDPEVRGLIEVFKKPTSGIDIVNTMIDKGSMTYDKEIHEGHLRIFFKNKGKLLLIGGLGDMYCSEKGIGDIKGKWIRTLFAREGGLMNQSEDLYKKLTDFLIKEFNIKIEQDDK